MLFIGDGADVYEKLLLDALGRVSTRRGEDYRSFAAQPLPAWAEERFRVPKADDLGTLAPVYLRPSEAEVKRNNLILTCR